MWSVVVFGSAPCALYVRPLPPTPTHPLLVLRLVAAALALLAIRDHQIIGCVVCGARYVECGVLGAC